MHQDQAAVERAYRTLETDGRPCDQSLRTVRPVATPWLASATVEGSWHSAAISAITDPSCDALAGRS